MSLGPPLSSVLKKKRGAFCLIFRLLCFCPQKTGANLAKKNEITGLRNDYLENLNIYILFVRVKVSVNYDLLYLCIALI